MKIKKIVVVLLSTAVLCTGCGSSSGGQEQGSQARAGETQEEHLDFYESFGHFNENDYFNGFAVSEVWENGEPYYQLRYKEEAEDVTVRVNDGQTLAKVYHGGNSMEFEIPYFYTGMASGGNFALLDLTGDGEKELIYVSSESGTGFLEGTSRVFNLQDMTEYRIEPFIGEMENRIQVTPISVEPADGGRQIICRMKDAEGAVFFGSVYGQEGNAAEDYTYAPDEVNPYYNLAPDLSEGRLKAVVSVGLEECFGNYLGQLTCYLEYREETGSFAPAAGTELEVFEPVIQISFAENPVTADAERWELEVTNTLSQDAQISMIPLLEICREGTWETVPNHGGFCGTEDILSAGESRGAVVELEWYDALEPGRYRISYEAGIQIGEYAERTQARTYFNIGQ